MDKTSPNDKAQPVFWLLLILSVVINLGAINTPFFSDDPGLYGSIAKQLIYRHEFWQLHSYGRDWLDKPHLPFWCILLSFKLCGIHTWSYKLPALLCFLLSLVYTWLFTKKYYGVLTAQVAVLIVSTALHIIMSNADVRAEPYLMAFITGAIYHISCLNEGFSWKHFFLTALLTALAIMTKGLFVIVPVGAALFGQLFFQKKLKDLLQWRWPGLILATIILTLPELYALYVQFDSHPEIIIREQQHVSGIKWFLWDSQFGRFSNAGPITRPSGDIFFYLHTLLWAFAPWCLVFYYALFRLIKKIIAGIKLPEYYSLSGGVLLVALFSFSGFQLPFYTNIIFPLFSIITACFCVPKLQSRLENRLRSIALYLYIIAFPVVLIVLHFFLRPVNYNLFIVASAAALAGAAGVYRTRLEKHLKVFALTCLVMVLTGFYINFLLYPVLVDNMGQIKAANEINTRFSKRYPVYSLKDQNNIFQFYCDSPVHYVQFQDYAKTPTEENAVFYADKEALDYFNQNKISYVVLKSFDDYPQEALLPKFIDLKTRATTLQKVYLIKKR